MHDPPESVYGSVTVESAGTSRQLWQVHWGGDAKPSPLVKRLEIVFDESNSGAMYVMQNRDVDYSNGRGGRAYYANDVLTQVAEPGEWIDIRTYWVDAETSGDKVRFVGSYAATITTVGHQRP